MRTRGLVTGVLGVGLLVGAAAAQADRELPAVPIQPRMGEPLAGLYAAELDRFDKGQVVFEAFLLEGDGLGPGFNDTSCASCHALPSTGGSSATTVTRFGKAAAGATPFDLLESLGGSPLQK
jgi:hypothetical protein